MSESQNEGQRTLLKMGETWVWRGQERLQPGSLALSWALILLDLVPAHQGHHPV
jgi:hypothetical protein